jgi:hypothetical protein
MTMHGVIFVTSLLWLTTVICVVYSVAQAPSAPVRSIARQSLRRMAKLGGVLVGLGIAVHFLSQ